MGNIFIPQTELPEGWVESNLATEKDPTPGYYALCPSCAKVSYNKNDKSK